MLKVTVIGGGSTYTPELVKGFIDRIHTFPLTELWLMDIDVARLEIVGGFARRMVAAKGDPFKVILSTNQKKAIAGADYVITQLRVGQMAARRADEYLGRRHGLIGQETTGVGGMAKALRTIPVVLEIASDMREVAQEAMLINFTNPSGLITEALSRHAPEVLSVGVCNSALTTKMAILAEISKLTGVEVSADRAVLKTLGLNHLTWYYGFELDGKDIWDMVIKSYVEKLGMDQDPEFDPGLVRSLGMIPNSYLKYYYHTAKMLEKQSHWPPSRAEMVMEIEKELLKQYANPELLTPPDALMLRGGAWYSTVATQLLNAHYNDLNEEHVVNTGQGGAVKGWDPGWVMEMPCRIDRAGIHPIPAEPLPEGFDLIKQVKAYELLTIEAAVQGDRLAARQALLVHPLGPKADDVDAVLEDMLQTNQPYLPRFFD